MRDQPFNPLDKENLGISVSNALLETAMVPLADMQKFKGAGIYALYYKGGMKAYAPLVSANLSLSKEIPIYVGKAVPAGARKGGVVDSSKSTSLYSRLTKHLQSINEAQNLDSADFYCRYLVVDDIWIPLGESLMIAMFSPVWNQFLDGFGNNDPGRGRYKQERSRWDVLHQGRPWAEKCAVREESQSVISDSVLQFLKSML